MMISNQVADTKVRGTNTSQWAIELTSLHDQMQVYGIIKGLNNKLDEPPLNMTARAKNTPKHWMNCCSVARSAILLSIQSRIEAIFTVINAGILLWEMF
jgi:hypothetical protein